MTREDCWSKREEQDVRSGVNSMFGIHASRYPCCFGAYLSLVVLLLLLGGVVSVSSSMSLSSSTVSTTTRPCFVVVPWLGFFLWLFFLFFCLRFLCASTFLAFSSSTCFLLLRCTLDRSVDVLPVVTGATRNGRHDETTVFSYLSLTYLFS